jgi:hypothetical protein
MKSLLIAALLIAVTGCASDGSSGLKSSSSDDAQDIKIAPFSANPVGNVPAEWEPMIIQRNKKMTEYQLVADEGRSVLHARAASASSGLMHKVDIDPMMQRELHWQWRISRLVEDADNYDRTREDSPARIILGFDGDKDALPFADQIMFETAKLVTGRDFPYATLMYIWGRKAPVDTVITNARSNRVKMIVAATGREGVGQWHALSRDIVADYERAFGEKPGRLIGVGVLTDTDNTGETVEAWYGDIDLQRRAMPIGEID